MNDGQPTFEDQRGGTGRILDMVIVTPSLSVISECWPSADAYGSDHFPVFLTVNVRISNSCESSNRLRLNKVDCALFREMTNQYIVEVNQIEHPSVFKKYHNFINSSITNFKRSGAYVPSSNS